MSDPIFRPYQHEKDKKAIQRNWVEIGWIEDDDDAKQHDATNNEHIMNSQDGDDEEAFCMRNSL